MAERSSWQGGNFCRAVGREDLLRRKDVAGPVDFGGSDGEQLARELQQVFHSRTLAEWVEVAVEHDIAMGPANQLGDLLTDPHLRQREIIADYQDPHAGPVTFVGWAAPVQGQPFEVGRAAPCWGSTPTRCWGRPASVRPSWTSCAAR